MKKGFITIPTDSDVFEETKKFIDYWGADAVRDCDGTNLPENVKDFNCEVYKTYFIVRGDNAYAKKHKEYLQNFALISKRYTAFSNTLEIPLLEDIIEGQCEVNLFEYKKYWQVFDRTTGELHQYFDYIGDNKILIKNAKKFHEYTVNYFALNTWDPVQIYNYVTNNWTCEKDLDLDPIYDEALSHMLVNMENWLKENKNVTVVRFTTFFYNFFFLWIDGKKQKLFDWHNYASTASPKMFEKYKEIYHEEITLEDLVTEGYYANRFIIPNSRTRKYIDMVQKLCCGWAKQFVDLCHKYNKKTMMFDGDNRIGTEPYNPYFASIGLDAVVGAPHSGIYIRQLSSMTGIKYVEGRLNPYFFPDTIPNDEKATNDLTIFWNNERRAMLKKPLDRIGFGGYLSLASKYPKFCETIKNICDEFRLIKESAGKEGALNHVSVGIISYYGKLNTWMMNGIGIDDVWQDNEAYSGLLLALAGQPVDVKFISFDEIINGETIDVDVLITNGIPQTSFSGGECWKNELLVSKIREFVFNGGGFIGIGDASGYQYQGKYFQLSDVMGVDKEVGFSYMLYHDLDVDLHEHFITDGLDNLNLLNYSASASKSVYSLGAKVLDVRYDNHFPKGSPHTGHLSLAINNYGLGRSVYFAGLADGYENRRTIYKSILWAAKKEKKLYKAFSKAFETDCFYYPSSGNYAIINNVNKEIKTIFYDINQKSKEIILKPNEIKWIKGDKHEN